MHQKNYLSLQGINVSNIEKKKMDNHDRIRKEGYSNLLFDHHNHEVVGCIYY